MFVFKFNIEEQPDGKSFLFYDITGVYSAENATGWGEGSGFDYLDVNSAKIEMRRHKTNDVLTIDLLANEGFASQWKDGIEVYNDGKIFEDDAYEFTVYINDEVASVRSFGFAALIKAEVMVQSLNYSPSMDRRLKELMYEKIRLLDNLFYAGETNQIEYFLQNLDNLKKLR